MRENKIMNINQLYNYSIAKTMHRAMQGNLPVPLQKEFQIDSTNGNLFKVNPCRIKRTGISILQAGPKIWNSLPISLLSETENKKFQSSMKSHVINI